VLRSESDDSLSVHWSLDVTIKLKYCIVKHVSAADKWPGGGMEKQVQGLEKLGEELEGIGVWG
jgi:hypothetical protein